MGKRTWIISSLPEPKNDEGKLGDIGLRGLLVLPVYDLFIEARLLSSWGQGLVRRLLSVDEALSVMVGHL